jgi:hypothetical protein
MRTDTAVIRPAAEQYSIWLLPAASDDDRLRQTIARLAVGAGGEDSAEAVQGLERQRFDPHVTIQGDIRRPLDQLTERLDALAATVPVQRWRVGGVETSEHFFRCLYLRFVPDPAFDVLQHEARLLTQTEDGLSPFAHLSLAYGQANAEVEALGARLADEFAGREIVFDRLAISLSCKDLPIEAWRCVAERRLAPRRNTSIPG